MSKGRKYAPWLIAAGTFGVLWYLSRPKAGVQPVPGASGTAQGGAEPMAGALPCDGPITPSWQFAGHDYA